MNSTDNQITTPAAAKVAATDATRAPASVRAAPVRPAKAVRKQVAKKPVAVAATPTSAKTIAKTPVKTAAKAPVKANAKPALKPRAEKLAKAKKPKLVRDSFTIPKAEFTVIEELKARAGKLARAVKKSELIRAGIKALAAMSDRDFLGALKAVPTIKTGRPLKAD